MISSLHDKGVVSSVPRTTFAEKVVRSLALMYRGYEYFGERLVVEHNPTRESCVVWDLAKRISPKIKGFCVVTRFLPPEAIQFTKDLAARYPEISIYENFRGTSDDLPRTAPYRCCELLRNQPKHWALAALNIGCLVTGFRHVRGSASFDLNEFQKVPGGLYEFTPSWPGVKRTFPSTLPFGGYP